MALDLTYVELFQSELKQHLKNTAIPGAKVENWLEIKETEL